MERAQSRLLVDLCAGAGGAMPKINRILTDDLDCAVDIVLTDYFPNVAAFRRIESESQGSIKGRYDSVSALDVPADLTGVRTLFTALHHFEPEQARMILADAVRKRAAIAIFEPLERTGRMV